MPTSASAVITSDINFTLIKIGSNNQSESSRLNYELELSDGSGALQINYGVIDSGVLASGGKEYFDLYALEKTIFDLTSTVQFSKIKSIIFENNETGLGWDIKIYCTGSLAFTEMFNGGSGNLLIKPYGTHIYTDAISGATVDATNRQLTLEDVSGSGARWTMIAVGVTG